MKVFNILAAALLCTGLVFATSTSAKTMKAKAPAAKMISGSVVSVDAVGNTVVIKSVKAEDTLSVNDSTKITVGGKEAKVGDLTADMKVMAYYKMEDGKNVATKIAEKKAKAEKKAAMSTKKAEKAAADTTTSK